MITTKKHDDRIANMVFADIYPLYLQKIAKKNRTKQELDQVIEWLTGFNVVDIDLMISKKVNFLEFFDKANLNPNASLITGSICGYKIQEITNPLTKKVRYLDKLVDDLYKGRKIEKILYLNSF